MLKVCFPNSKNTLEILWGHRFRNMIHFQKGQYLMDFETFHATAPVETPLCSAKTLQEIRDLKASGLTGHEIMATLEGSRTWSQIHCLVSSPTLLNPEPIDKIGNHRYNNSVSQQGAPNAASNFHLSNSSLEDMLPTLNQAAGFPKNCFPVISNSFGTLK